MASADKRRESHGVPRIKEEADSQVTVNGKPVTTLKLWIVRIVQRGVIVEGYKQVSAQDLTTLQNWRSSEIVTRMEGTLVATRSGSVYKLKGAMDQEEAADAGFPAHLIGAFASGFPEDWEELIREHVEGIEAQRLQSMNTTTTMESTMDEGEEGRGMKAAKGKKVDLTMEEEDELREETIRRRIQENRSMNKCRKSMMQHVQPATPIEEEDEEEEEETPARRKTPAGRNKNSETPVTRKEDKKTPGRGGKGAEKKESKEDGKEEKEQREPGRAASATRAARTPRGAVDAGKKTPKRHEEDKEEEEVFATPDESPRGKNTTRTVAIGGGPVPNQKPRRVGRLSIPREILDKAIPLSRWVLAFVKGGTPKSIFPHFQFLIRGMRPECGEDEWKTSAIQKVVPPHIMFTSSSIYRLDGPLDVDQSTDMGFPPPFITDFLMGFPDDWEDRLETFFNKTFGPPPQPRIVELQSDGETCNEDEKQTATGKEKISKRNGREEEEKESEERQSAIDKQDEERKVKIAAEEAEYQKNMRQRSFKNENSKKEDKELEEEKSKKKFSFNTPRNQDGQKIRCDSISFPMGEQFPASSRKRKEPTPQSDSGEESESDYEERLRREAEKVEKRMRREEKKAKRERLEKDRPANGVNTSRSGRLLRTPRATWAGEHISYDVHGNAVGMAGVTTTTKLTVGKTNHDHTELMAAHYGIDSPLAATTQKERSTAPPLACLPKTPAPKKSKADGRGYSDDETDKKIYFDQYMSMLAAQAEATPAFNLKRGKRRLRVVESSDSEAEAEERRKEERRKEKEERRRLKESEEEESSDDGYRRKKKSNARKKGSVKKEVNVKKEKQVKRASSKKRTSKKEESEEEEEGSDLEIEHDGDAVTFVPSEEGSNEGAGNGYSDDDQIQSEEEEKKSKKREPVKRARVWKKEELLRLKLAIQAADPSTTADGWENVAKSLGGGRTAEECKKMARERLKLKVDEQRVEEEEEEDGSESGAESGAFSEDEEKKNKRKGKLDGITAKKGTVKYAVEMEQKKREMIMGGSSSQDDFFKDAKARMSGVEPLPSVAVFDPNDSLLSIFDDDDAPQQPKTRTTKTALMAAAPATPRLAELSSMESPGTSTGGSGRRTSNRFIPSPVVNPNDLTRYVHHLSRTKNMSMLNRSMADQSRMMPPRLPRGRNVARTAEAIDKVENTLRNQRKGREEMNSLEEDEENDDNVLPAGF